MKRIIGILILVQGFGFMASAQDRANEMLSDEVEIMYRSCNSKYLRHPETCWSNTKDCPAGWDGQASMCWSRSKGKFYRCGTVCESIYRGGA